MSPDAGKFDEVVGYMRNLIRRQVAAGFDATDGIAESAVESAVAVISNPGVDAGTLRPLAQEYLRDRLAEHYRAQTEWPDKTDCDRLDEAFAELETRGIVCRQNFSCCGTCGSSEIWGEMHAARDAGLNVRGYAFYHMQDTDSGVERGHLYLGYGATDAGEDAALAVAQEIVAVLNAHGLVTDWSGSWNERIGVTIDWKRRRPIVGRFTCRKPTRGLFDDYE